jgi:hypothetical protein
VLAVAVCASRSIRIAPLESLSVKAVEIFLAFHIMAYAAVRRSQKRIVRKFLDIRFVVAGHTTVLLVRRLLQHPLLHKQRSSQTIGLTHQSRIGMADHAVIVFGGLNSGGKRTEEHRDGGDYR